MGTGSFPARKTLSWEGDTHAEQKEPTIDPADPHPTVRLSLDWAGARFEWSATTPVALTHLPHGSDSPAVRRGLVGRADVGVVEVFTADEQRGRTSQAYVHSAVGDRLRYVEHSIDAQHEGGAGEGECLTIVQHDWSSGLTASIRITVSAGCSAFRFETTLINGSDHPLTVTAVTSAVFGIGADQVSLDGVTLYRADSEWLAENRWTSAPLRASLPRLDLPLHGQDGRGRFAVTSHGAWSTGEHLPIGILVDDETTDAVLWQIETSGAWHWEMSQSLAGATLSLTGATDLEHQFAHELMPGESFDAVPVAVVAATGGRDAVIGEATRYRRALRQRMQPQRAGREGLPLVYNDFMNTLMGQPTTEALLPLVAAAAEDGAEYFCIDAGWFADPAIGDWWSTVGEWEEAPSRFRDGLLSVTESISAHGMKVGLWLEPEVVGADTPLARSLPEEAFFRRFGRRVREHDRYQLDFRHPAARAHLDRTVDRLIDRYDVAYFKFDYNINPGAGTDTDAAAPGDGLLAHTRAFQAWLADIQHRHPDLLIENCSSGAMRADYSLLAVTHLQSTSDQQDHLLYPPIAAAAPAGIVPEQCGNWAYPSAVMSLEETAFTLVTGLSGRLYLSGFLDRLRQEQRELVRAAAAAFKETRSTLTERLPFWPLGLPGWDDEVVCVALRGEADALLALWHRGASPASVLLEGVHGESAELFPVTPSLGGWHTSTHPEGTLVEMPAGPTARFYRFSLQADS